LLGKAGGRTLDAFILADQAAQLITDRLGAL
jgi:hypothetical protein